MPMRHAYSIIKGLMAIADVPETQRTEAHKAAAEFITIYEGVQHEDTV
jgi:hypothetical protein